MVRCALTSLLAISNTAPADAEWIDPTLDLASVLVEVTWVADERELADIRKRYETPLQRSKAGASTYGKRPDDGILSFSVLGKRDGNWVCLIFARHPQRVDDERTLQLGHELVHCLLGDYHTVR